MVRVHRLVSLVALLLDAASAKFTAKDCSEQRVAGSCNFLPCSEKRGESVECIFGWNLSLHGTRGLFGFGKVCACKEGFCSFDSFRCKNLSEWNAELEAMKADVVQGSYKSESLLAASYFFCYIIVALCFATAGKCLFNCRPCHTGLFNCIFNCILSQSGGRTWWWLEWLFVLVWCVCVHIDWGVSMDACKVSIDKSINLSILIFGVALILFADIRYTFKFRDSFELRLEGARVMFESIFVENKFESYVEYLRCFQVFSRMAGMNLVIIYGMQRSFVLTVFFLGLITCARNFSNLRSHILTIINGQESESAKGPTHVDGEDWLYLQDGTRKLRRMFIGIKPYDVYLDLRVPIGKKCFLVFLTQIFLTCLYVTGIHEDIALSLCKNSINWELTCPTLLIQILMVTRMGKGFVPSLHDWMMLLSDRDTKIWQLKEEPGRKWIEELVEAPGLRGRFCMAVVVNCVVCELLIQSVFLTLVGCTSSLDYVKDCLAIVFITELDDIDEDEDTLFVKASAIREQMKRLRSPKSREPLIEGSPAV